MRSLERASDQYGRAFEQWIYMELKAYSSYRRLHLPLCFWRSVNGQGPRRAARDPGRAQIQEAPARLARSAATDDRRHRVPAMAGFYRAFVGGTAGAGPQNVRTT